MKFSKKQNPNESKINYHTKNDCSVSKASNEIMIHRITGGKDIEFPFSSLIREQS